jgi:ADP-ribose pyrophosphatase YjhB (NUDIX family)
MEKLFAYLFGSKPRKKQLKELSGKTMFVAPGSNPFSPSFALVDGWLAIGTTPEMVRRIVATSVGQKPSILDLSGFSEKVSADSRPFFMLSYVDCSLLFEDLKSYAQAIIQKGDRFEPDAVETTMVPFLDALKKIGKLGGALTQKNGNATGTVVPL